MRVLKNIFRIALIAVIFFVIAKAFILAESTGHAIRGLLP